MTWTMEQHELSESSQTVLGGVTDTLDSCVANRRDMDKLVREESHEVQQGKSQSPLSAEL